MLPSGWTLSLKSLIGSSNPERIDAKPWKEEYFNHGRLNFGSLNKKETFSVIRDVISHWETPFPFNYLSLSQTLSLTHTRPHTRTNTHTHAHPRALTHKTQNFPALCLKLENPINPLKKSKESEKLKKTSKAKIPEPKVWIPSPVFVEINKSPELKNLLHV